MATERRLGRVTGRLRRPRGSTRRDPAPARPPRRELAAFFVTAVLTLAGVSTITATISGRLAEDNARREAEESTVRLGRFLIQPLLEEALAGEPGAWDELDRRVQNRLSDRSIHQLVVWSARGEVVYANEAGLVGRTFPPSAELLRAVEGEVVSDVDAEPEASYPPAPRAPPGPLVEVYVPLPAAGERLALEAYFDSASIEREAAALRGQVLPLAVGALLVLQLVQVPIVASLFRRVRRQDEERADLLLRSLTASERERRAIAADVHDGPVQDLAGVSYALAALRADLPAQQVVSVDRLIAALRQAVHSLRRLIITLYPPDLSSAALGPALEDLADPVRTDGVDVTVDVGPLPELPPAIAAAVYRTAKEALENVHRHAGAAHAWVTLGETGDTGTPAVRLQVADDGMGLPTGNQSYADGHLGLRLLRDRVADMGGHVEFSPRDGGGTIVTATIPVPDTR